MSFSIEPKVGPSIVQPEGMKTAVQLDARERAIAKLIGESQAPKVETRAPDAQPLTPQPQESRPLDSTVEAQPSAPAESSAPKDEPLSSQYAILARKEKAFRARDAELRRREEAIKASEAPKAAQAPSFDESRYISKDKLQSDLFGTLAELGLTYDQITAQGANAPTPEQVEFKNTIKSLQDEIKALRGDQEQTKKTFEQQQQDSYKQAVNQIRLEAKTMVNSSDAYETIRETNSVDDIVELIEKTFNEDGTLLTVEEAAREVEEYLVDEALKIARLKKIQQRLAPPSQTPNIQVQSKTVANQQPQLKTLTNSVASTRQLSARERAELAFHGKLNKQA